MQKPRMAAAGCTPWQSHGFDSWPMCQTQLPLSFAPCHSLRQFPHLQRVGISLYFERTVGRADVVKPHGVLDPA